MVFICLVIREFSHRNEMDTRETGEPFSTAATIILFGNVWHCISAPFCADFKLA